MQHWVLNALRGSRDQHEVTHPLVRSGSKHGVSVVVRLRHLALVAVEKELDFQIGFFNPTARSYLVDVKWQIDHLSGESNCILEPARGFYGKIYEQLLIAGFKVPVGRLVHAEAMASHSRSSVKCATECSH
jgi:hypothetical protein